jgi:UDP-N-acetylmuramoyl-tripeptide--D-alanyl-D-alanine ligase
MISLKTFTDKKLYAHIIKVWNQKDYESQNVKRIVIETDTRTYREGNAFFAIKGEIHDPFKYLEKNLINMPLVVFESNQENNEMAETWSKNYPHTQFISVKNSVRYLQLLSELHVQEWYQISKIHYQIAISGSNGKTTTKEMLYHILNQVFGNEVIGTKKNNNNHIGVPLTLLEIHPEKTKVAVVEFGSNHPGEMKVLCDLAHPNVGITTNIGFTHMEFFNDLRDVFVEEGQIFYEVMQQTSNQGLFLINEDDNLLKEFNNHQGTKRFSINNPKVDFFYEISTNSVKIHYKNGQQISLTNDYITGSHNFINLANAYVLASELFPFESEKSRLAAASFKPTANRSQWIIFQEKDIFLDAYNANPSSMRAALDSFIKHCLSQGMKKSELLIVVGEMKELGAKSASYHYEFAKWLAELDLDHVIYVGGYQDEIKKACSKIIVVDNVEKAQNYFQLYLKTSKKCFIKASRSLQLERLVGITKG